METFCYVCGLIEDINYSQGCATQRCSFSFFFLVSPNWCCSTFLSHSPMLLLHANARNANGEKDAECEQEHVESDVVTIFNSFLYIFTNSDHIQHTPSPTHPHLYPLFRGNKSISNSLNNFYLPLFVSSYEEKIQTITYIKCNLFLSVYYSNQKQHKHKLHGC